MISLLITADALNMKKLADCIVKSSLVLDGIVRRREGEEGGHEMKISCNTEQLFSLFMLCGERGIALNVKTLYSEAQAVSAVVWTV